MGKVELRQIWASTDRRDIEAGHNQWREVVGVIGSDVWLTGSAGYWSRIRAIGGSLPRHRLVEDTAE